MCVIALYLRVSTDEQAKYGYGLDAQEQQCKKYIDLYYPDNDIVIYKDDGYSAKDLNRPKMAEMLEDARLGKVNMIVAYKLDRLTRNVVDAYDLIKKVTDYDCQLVAVMEKLDLETANGRMMVGILAIFAQWERELITERTNDGLEEMAEKGKYPCANSPFGWDKDENKFLSINQKETEIVNELGDKSIDGMNCVQLSAYLMSNYGIKKSDKAIKQILSRDMNVGIFEYHGKIYLNIVPPIMTQGKFERIKQSLRIRKNCDMEQYLFYNLVYCKCGEKCANRTTKKNLKTNSKYYYYYECDTCKKRINQNDLLNDAIIQILCHEAKEKLSKEITEKEKRLNKLRHEMTMLHQKYDDGFIDINVYTNTLQRIKNKMNKLSKSIISLKIKGKDEFFNLTQEQKFYYIQEKVRRLVVDLDLMIVTHIEWREEKII